MMAATITVKPSGFADLMFPYNAHVVEMLKLDIPSDCRSWDPQRKLWTVAPSWRPTAERILRSVFGEVDVVEEWRTYAPPPPPRFADSPYAALHLRETAPPELVTVAYKCMARLVHPDHGGSTQAMQEINTAYDDLKARGAVAGGPS